MQSLVSHWGYLALFLITALSAFGVPIGSELAMVYGGALASGQVLGGREHFELGLVILIAVLGEIAESLAGYGLGRFGGRPLVDNVGRYLLLTHRGLDCVEAYLARSGESFVLVGRLVPLLDPSSPSSLGSQKWPFGDSWCFPSSAPQSSPLRSRVSSTPWAELGVPRSRTFLPWATWPWRLLSSRS